MRQLVRTGCMALATLALLGARPSQALDLAQAYALSLAQDATLRAAQAGAAADQERVPQARAQLLPNLSASLGASANQLDSWQDELRTARHKRYPSDNQSVTLRQALFRPALTAGLRQAQAQVEDSALRLQQALNQLSVRVGEAYFNTLLAQDQWQLMRGQSQSYAVQLDASRKALAAGAGMRTDVDEAVARLDLSRAQEMQARQQVEHAQRALAALIAQPVSAVQGLNNAQRALRAPQPADAQAWMDMAERHSPELQSLQARWRAVDEQLQQARAAHLPTLDLIAQWQRSKSENALDVENRYRRSSLGVQLNVPLYAGGYVQSTVRQSLAEQARLEAEIEALKRDLSLRINQAHRGVTEGIARIQALEQAARSAEQLARSNRRSLEAGSRTLVDVFNAEQQLMVAQRDLAQARYEQLMSRIRLQALAGMEPAVVLQEISAELQR